jgi:hypothetical protein
MIMRVLATGAAALLIAGVAAAQPSEPAKPSAGKERPSPSAQVMGGTVRNGNAAVSGGANMAAGSNASARAADRPPVDCAKLSAKKQRKHGCVTSQEPAR